MPNLPVVDRAIAAAARRCSVPRDLEPITVRGDEAESGGIADTIWARVEDLYRSGMHPAIQVCVRHRGEVILERAIGHARGNLPGRRFERDNAVPLTLNTPVNLFSAAKAVTGMTMHKLAEQGLVDLDDPVAEYFPGFERHGKGDITLRHVLTHRAAIASMPAEAYDLDLLADPEAVDEVLRDLRPSAEPGGAPGYHAITGGFVMEAVARNVAGRSLRDILRTEVKEPLGLTWFDFGVAPDEAPHVAQNVETGLPLGPIGGQLFKRVLGAGWGQLLRMSNDHRFLTAVIPSGNTIVTARDVATFYQCILNGGSIDGTRIFEESTVAAALEPVTDMTFDRMLAIPLRYSAGFMLGTESISFFGWNRPRAFGHIGLSNLLTWADPDDDIVVALLTTGKPVVGTHLGSFVSLLGGLYTSFAD